MEKNHKGYEESQHKIYACLPFCHHDLKKYWTAIKDVYTTLHFLEISRNNSYKSIFQSTLYFPRCMLIYDNCGLSHFVSKFAIIYKKY